MKRHFDGQTRTILIAGFAIVGAALLAQACAAPIDTRLKRQLNVMEKVFDEVLVESPNLLVMSSNPTHSFYMDEFGAVFTFEASLTSGSGGPLGLDFLNRMKVVTKDGKTIVTFSEDEDSSAKEKAIEVYVNELERSAADDEDEDEIGAGDEDEPGDSDADDEEDEDEDADEDEDEALSEADRYAAGKQELIEGLMDYGETMTSLRDDQWVTVAVFLQNADIFKKSDFSHLVLKVRMRDLRANADGRLAREALKDRIVIEEY